MKKNKMSTFDREMKNLKFKKAFDKSYKGFSSSETDKKKEKKTPLR